METPLEEAKGLSKQLGSTVLLKREDLQVGAGWVGWVTCWAGRAPWRTPGATLGRTADLRPAC